MLILDVSIYMDMSIVEVDLSLCLYKCILMTTASLLYQSPIKVVMLVSLKYILAFYCAISVLQDTLKSVLFQSYLYFENSTGTFLLSAHIPGLCCDLYEPV